MNQNDQGKPEMEDLFAPPKADNVPVSKDIPDETEEIPDFDPSVFERPSGTIVFPGANVPVRYDTDPPPQPQHTVSFYENAVPTVSGSRSEDPAVQKARPWGVCGGVIGLIIGCIFNAMLNSSGYKLPLCCALLGAKIGRSIYRYLIDTT